MFACSFFKCNTYIKKAKNIHINNNKNVAAESNKIETDCNLQKLKIIQKDERSKLLIEAAIKKNEFLRNIINKQQMALFIDSMYLMTFGANECIIKEGDNGNHVYISYEGYFEVTKSNIILKRFTIGEVFGELALLHNCKRNATVKTRTVAKVWCLDRDTFQYIMVQPYFKERERIAIFLSTVSCLQKLSSKQLLELADLVTKEFFPSGSIIIRQGDYGDKFYIIHAGQVTISQRVKMTSTEKNEDCSEKDVLMGILKKGCFFGELALMHNKNEFCQRQATIIAQAPGVECYTLDRQSFETYLLQQNIFNNKSYNKELKIIPTNVLKYNTEYSHIQLKDLYPISNLRQGSFGIMKLVEYKPNKKLQFILKQISKQRIQNFKQLEHIYNEKNILLSCDHYFINRLYSTFKDNSFVYLLLEPCLGGDISTLLQQQKYLNENLVKFISACVVLAIEYLHKQGIIYRNLKPNSVLIDHKTGYVKLTDFQLAKRLLSTDEKTYTFCSDTNYLSPEQILNLGHSYPLDFWMLGMFIGHLLCGNNLFLHHGHHTMDLYKNILKGINKISFPEQIDDSAQNIIKKLCNSKCSERLGYQRGNFNDIKNHRWFMKFNWKSLENQSMLSPIDQSSFSNKYEFHSSFDEYYNTEDYQNISFQSFEYNFQDF